jgi:3-oxoadipate enol-lactonase
VPYASIDAGDLYYEQHGHGPDLLCIQGVGVDVSAWRAQIPALAREYRVTVFDNRDVGRSFYATAPYDVAALAADTLALADRLELGRFHVLGSSLGGAIAQELALSAPERVRSLTLCVSWAGNGAWGRAHAQVAIAAAAHLTEEELTRALMLGTLSERTFEEMARELETMNALVRAYPHRQRREGYIRQLEAGATHETRPRLPALSIPTHVIGAEQDLLVPVWKSRELAELIPGARLSVIDGAAHAVNIERSAEYNELVLSFLRSIDTRLTSAS